MNADSGTHTLTVPTEDEGVRVDRWLHGHFPELSRSVIQRYIDEGRVTIDGARPKPSTALRAGSCVSVEIPPPPPAMPIPQDIPLDVVFEDDALLVINKPAGLVVHSSPGVADGGSVVNALLNHTDQLSDEGGAYRPGIVHRLDRETSGLLIIARTNAVHRNLAAQFKDRTVHKVYVACVHGQPRETEGVIDQPIGRSLTHRKKMALRFDERGKPSLTRWRLDHTSGKHSWVSCFPETGRTHQIRVHLQSIQHPILCDFLYGREKQITRSELFGRRPQGREEPILTRHALHARSISFQHPTEKREVEFEAPLPEDMQTILDSLRS